MAQRMIVFQAQGSDAAMPHLQQQAAQPDCNEPHAIVLATLAGNEHHMPANLAHYEDLSQLEDDVVNFLPTVSDIEVFGCEVDLIMSDTKLPLRDPIHSTLKKQNRLQVIVRPCMEEGHSVWQFQDGNQEGYPKRCQVPVRPRRPRSAWRGWKMACLWRPRSASLRAQSASSSVERRWQQGLVRPRHRCNRPRPAWRGHEIRSWKTTSALGSTSKNTRST